MHLMTKLERKGNNGWRKCLNWKILDILDQKNTKLLLQNLRGKVRVLGVIGTLEQKEDLIVKELPSNYATCVLFFLIVILFAILSAVPAFATLPAPSTNPESLIKSHIFVGIGNQYYCPFLLLFLH